jgi:hypothetical protein
MNFNEKLRKQREVAQFTQEVAAGKLRLSLRAYQDCEEARTSVNFPQKVGMFIALGMRTEEALITAGEPDNLDASELVTHLIKETTDSYVRETEDLFILLDRQHDFYEYPISKERVRTPEHILGWVEHLSEKGWVTRDHLKVFVACASRHLRLAIHSI